MACSTVLTGIALDCANAGGIKKVYIAPIADVSSVTVTAGKVTAITMGEVGKKFKEYSFRKNTASLTKTATKDDAAGTSFVTSEVALRFAKMDSAKRTEMQALLTGNVYVIVLDNNGQYWFLGYDSYCSASAATGESGTALGDANQYTINLSAETVEFPQTVDDSIIAALIG